MQPQETKVSSIGSSILPFEGVRVEAGAVICPVFAGVAQLVEHRFCKPKVRGSSPLSSSVLVRGVETPLVARSEFALLTPTRATALRALPLGRARCSRSRLRCAKPRPVGRFAAKGVAEDGGARALVSALRSLVLSVASRSGGLGDEDTAVGASLGRARCSRSRFRFAEPRPAGRFAAGALRAAAVHALSFPLRGTSSSQRLKTGGLARVANVADTKSLRSLGHRVSRISKGQQAMREESLLSISYSEFHKVERVSGPCAGPKVRAMSPAPATGNRWREAKFSEGAQKIRPSLREGAAIFEAGLSARETVGCPSGQREQAVNLPELSYVGSNPSPTTRFLSADLLASPVILEREDGIREDEIAGVAQLVERQPSKLNVVGSNPISRSVSPSPEGRRRGSFAHIAQ